MDFIHNSTNYFRLGDNGGCHHRILFDGALRGKTMRAATGRPKYPIRTTQMGEVDPPIPVHRPVPESVLLSPGRGNHLL